jgi:hypothetical protein
VSSSPPTSNSGLFLWGKGLEKGVLIFHSILLHISRPISRLPNRHYHGPAGQIKELPRRETETGRAVQMVGVAHHGVADPGFFCCCGAGDVVWC